MTRIGRLAAATVLAAVLAAGLVAAVPASPAAAATCPAPDSGVTVVVDFNGLGGGGVVVRCASGDPASGLAALQGAGFEYSFVETHPGLVCRIDGLPDDSCRRAPPTTAYWSYWYADRGGSWTYSGRGGGGRDPDPGTVEGWAFGAGGQPSQPPPAPPDQPPPEPPPDDPPADGGGEDPPADAEPPPPDRRDEAVEQPPGGGAPDPGEPGSGAPSSPVDRPTAPGTEAGPAAPGGITAGTAAPAEPAASTATRTGGLAGVVVTAAAVVALAGAGFWTAHRRRARRPTPDAAGSGPPG